MGRWRGRSVAVPIAMAMVRRLWGRALRVGAHESPRLGTRSTTVLVDMDGVPVGWVAVRWLPSDETGLIHRVGWDAAAGRTEDDVWRALEQQAERPSYQPIAVTGRWLGSTAA